MAKPIISIVDPSDNRQYFLIWDTFYEEPYSVGADLLTISAVMYRITGKMDGLLSCWSNLITSGSSLMEFDENDFFEQRSMPALLQNNCTEMDAFNEENEQALNTLLETKEQIDALAMKQIAALIANTELPHPVEYYYSAHRKQEVLLELLHNSGASYDLLRDLLPQMLSRADIVVKLIHWLGADELEHMVNFKHYSNEEIQEFISVPGGEVFVKYVNNEEVNKAFWAKCIARNGAVLALFPGFFNKRDVVASAFSSIPKGSLVGKLFGRLPEELKQDREIILNAIQRDASSYHHLLERWKLDPEIAAAALRSDWHIFDELHPVVKGKQEIQEEHRSLKEQAETMPF